MSFQNLIFELIPNPVQDYKEKMIEGCQLMFPDTVFFDRGKLVICTMDRDYCISKENRKLTILQVRKLLDNQVKLRKSNTQPYCQ